MMAEKKRTRDQVTLTSENLRKYFPNSYMPQRIQETIIKPLEQLQRKCQQYHEYKSYFKEYKMSIGMN